MADITQRVIEILEQSQIDMLLSRLKTMQEWNSNSCGVEIKNFGTATAFSVKNIPDPIYNFVRRIHDEDEDYIDEIIQFYEKKELPIILEITPSFVSLKLLMTLYQKNFFHSGFRTVLYAPLTDITANQNTKVSPNVSIRPLKKDEFDIFGQIYVEGFQTSNSCTYDVARRNEILYTKEGWHFYLASVDNEPAGVGVLFIKDEVAILTDTTTIPKFRNLGIQKLLIKERIKQARKMNCKYIVSQTSVGSTGQLNMEKMGMKIAYTKAIWNRQTESI